MCKRLSAFFLLLFLTACGHTGLRHAEMIEAVKNADFETARKITADSDFYTDEPSLLVRYVELGSLHYLKGEYYQALQHFDKAHALSKKLYTKSVSKSVAAQIVGDGIVPYAGEKYELSLLRYYQSLTHFRLYEQGFYESYTVKEDDVEKTIERKDLSKSEKRLHFNAARASILDWNSLLTTYTKEADDENDFRQDMLAKTFGAEIHDIYDTTGDKQIARQLYKDTQRLLKSVYADYDAYSGEQKTHLTKYAQKKGKNLFEKPAKKDNVRFILNAGVITPKIAEEVDFHIPIHVFLASGSKNDLISCLGSILPGQRIFFEIPSMKKPDDVKSYQLIVKNSVGKTLFKKDMVLTAPVSETAYREFQKKRSGLISKKGARLTAKYVTAVISACALYDPNNSLSLFASYASFAIASAAIKASEYADIRYWGLLPHAVYQQSAVLKPGKYTGEILSNGKTLKTFTFSVKKSQQALIDVNLPNG